MSVQTPRPSAPRDATDTRCLQCGAELDDDQEWCLECGSARTLIHTPPDWRVPVAVLGGVVALVLVVFVVVLVNLSSDANTAANLAAQTTAVTAGGHAAPPKTATGSTPTTAAASTTASGSTTPSGSTTRAGATTKTGATASGAAATNPIGAGGLPTWPSGLPGWTVVVAKRRTRAAAYTTAHKIAVTGVEVGVLKSSQHPLLTPGFWVVFSGRYATPDPARSEAAKLVTLGLKHAHAKRVGKPGAP
jgi:hypothetical protein